MDRNTQARLDVWALSRRVELVRQMRPARTIGRVAWAERGCMALAALTLVAAAGLPAGCTSPQSGRRATPADPVAPVAAADPAPQAAAQPTAQVEPGGTAAVQPQARDAGAAGVDATAEAATRRERSAWAPVPTAPAVAENAEAPPRAEPPAPTGLPAPAEPPAPVSTSPPGDVSPPPPQTGNDVRKTAPDVPASSSTAPPVPPASTSIEKPEAAAAPAPPGETGGRGRGEDTRGRSTAPENQAPGSPPDRPPAATKPQAEPAAPSQSEAAPDQKAVPDGRGSVQDARPDGRGDRREDPPARMGPMGQPLAKDAHPGYLTMGVNPTTAAGRGEPSLDDVQRPCAWLTLDGKAGHFKTGMMQWTLDEPVGSCPTVSVWVVEELVGEIVDVRLVLRKLSTPGESGTPQADPLFQYLLRSRAHTCKAGQEYPLCSSADVFVMNNTATNEQMTDLPPLKPGQYALVGDLIGSKTAERTVMVTYFSVGDFGASDVP